MRGIIDAAHTPPCVGICCYSMASPPGGGPITLRVARAEISTHLQLEFDPNDTFGTLLDRVSAATGVPHKDLVLRRDTGGLVLAPLESRLCEMDPPLPTCAHVASRRRMRDVLDLYEQLLTWEHGVLDAHFHVRVWHRGTQHRVSIPCGTTLEDATEAVRGALGNVAAGWLSWWGQPLELTYTPHAAIEHWGVRARDCGGLAFTEGPRWWWWCPT
jgi:hypothetical protein